MNDFDTARKAVLATLLDLEQALEQLEGAVPLDDRGLALDRLAQAQRQVGDDLVMWMAHYDRPGVDPALVAEDLDDELPSEGNGA